MEKIKLWKNTKVKKIIGILILSFLWLSNGNAGVKEPGKINSLQCALGAMEAYQGAKEYREANPKKKHSRLHVMRGGKI